MRNIRRKSEFIHQEIESEKTDSGTSTEISEDEVDWTLNISKNSKSFVSVFDIADKKYVIDDLFDEAILLNKSSRKHGKYFNTNVSSVLYYLNS